MACGGCRHGVVTFLYESGSIKGTDKAFQPLILALHRIPFCATFGVSCAGHFNEYHDQNFKVDMLHASPCGHLNVIIDSSKRYTADLLVVIGQIVSGDKDAYFKKTDHLFGPKQGSCLEVWEIRMGDAGSLGEDEIGCRSFEKEKYPDLYRALMERCAVIKNLWSSLADAVNAFADEQRFGSPDIPRRAEELEEAWSK